MPEITDYSEKGNELNSQFLVRLKLGFDDVNSAGEEILGIYTNNSMIDDLDQIAWNMNECSDERQLENIGKPILHYTKMSRDSSGAVEVAVDLLFGGNNQDMIMEVVEEYLNNFSDYIHPIILGYESREGSRAGFTGELSNYDCDLSAQQ